eukprot:7463262-Karenia_brevis.AAC.1
MDKGGPAATDRLASNHDLLFSLQLSVGCVCGCVVGGPEPAPQNELPDGPTYPAVLNAVEH